VKRSSSASLLPAVLALGATLAACGPAHVQLSPPSPGAGLAERAAAYERMRALGTSTQTDVIVTNNMVMVAQNDFLQLADGHRVYHPSDLEPVVDADSATSRAIREHHDAKARANAWRKGTFIAMAAGVAAMVIGAAIWAGDEDSVAGQALFFGGGVVTSLSPFGLLGAIGPDIEARDARRTAFMTYDRDLRSAMGLCADGGSITDCTSAIPPLVAPTPAAPVAPAPAAPVAPAAPAPSEPAPVAPAPAT
jgi:hypothetical protein